MLWTEDSTPSEMVGCDPPVICSTLLAIYMPSGKSFLAFVCGCGMDGREEEIGGWASGSRCFTTFSFSFLSSVQR